MTGKIIVINPNSSEYMTDALSESVAPLRMAGGPEIECVTLAEGPPGIECAAHAAQVVDPMCALIRAREASAGAFVVACFGDPGLHAARDATSRPVLGMAESSMMAALALADNFAIISTAPASIRGHHRHIRALGLESRFAGDAAIGIGILDLAKDPARTLERMIEAGRGLKEERGAEALITGCAGMTSFRGQLQKALAVPVIEPSQAAVTLAIGAARLGYA